jgi:hypothetical protein
LISLFGPPIRSVITISGFPRSVYLMVVFAGHATPEPPGASEYGIGVVSLKSNPPTR